MFKKYKKGLVVGKFMPFHKGHEYLINFAKQYCDDLFVIVDCLENQTISPEQRKKWIEETLPNVTVIALNKFMPQEPSECVDFWEIWINEIIAQVGNPDVLIASMNYGWELSERLNCECVILDTERESINISATQIRNDTFANWDYLTNVVKRDYVKKISLIGPESTGKSTSAKNIAQLFQTVFVPEFAKNIINHQHGKFYEKNIIPTIQGQINSEKILGLNSNKIMLCDSDYITTLVWAKHLFNYENLELEKFLLDNYQDNYDITFLFYPDTLWISDSHRNVIDNAKDNAKDLNFRENMFADMEAMLNKFNRKYIVLHNGFDVKQHSIIEYIKRMYKLNPIS